jgi:uncharacterized protein
MHYEDKVYGKAEITEPVILELINCSTLQRLKEIDQIGYFEPYFPGTAHSRFEHSLGVFLLLDKYKAQIEEKIAGLIHDVSHSVFSHCIDYVLDIGSEKEHNHQDNIFDEFVRKSEIPKILKKHNLDVDYILDDNNFPLKEKNLPDICADRIDYSLRTAVIFKELKQKDAQEILDNLIVENNNWVFKNIEFVRKYAELFLKLNIKYYAGITSAVMFRTVGDYLRYALAKDYIEKNDLYGTDKQVLSKIAKYHEQDDNLELLFDRMSNKIGFKNDPNRYDAQVYCKSRVVDPLYKVGKEIKRISEIDKKWKVVLDKEMKPKSYFLKFDR